MKECMRIGIVSVKPFEPSSFHSRSFFGSFLFLWGGGVPSGRVGWGGGTCQKCGWILGGRPVWRPGLLALCL